MDEEAQGAGATPRVWTAEEVARYYATLKEPPASAIGCLVGGPIALALAFVGLFVWPASVSGFFALGALTVAAGVGVNAARKPTLSATAHERARKFLATFPPDLRSAVDQQEARAAEQRASGEHRRQERRAERAAESRGRRRAAMTSVRATELPILREVGIKLEGGGIACPRCNGTQFATGRQVGRKGTALTAGVVLAPVIGLAVAGLSTKAVVRCVTCGATYRRG